MTFEEAMNKLEAMRAEYDYTLHNEACDALDVAIRAVRKQIPKSYLGGYCPDCGNNIIGYQNIPAKYCPECGQAIGEALRPWGWGE